MSVVEEATKFLGSIVEAGTSPVFFGISGPQGSGKSYLAEHLLIQARKKYPHLSIVGFSMDDFYLTHDQQQEVTKKAVLDHNSVLQGRGLPGTHDMKLLLEVFSQIENKCPLQIPVYDKSAYKGEGDRGSEWQVVDSPVDVVIFEGWFNGFKAMDSDVFRNAYLTSDPSGIVQRHKLYHLEAVNDALREFEPIWNKFDGFVCLSSEIANVYNWRLQQEEQLIARKGTGMDETQVRAFVDRYMPMYLLYYRRMCEAGGGKKNLRIEIDASRTLLATSEF